MRNQIIKLLKRVPVLTGINQGANLDNDQKTMLVDELVYMCRKFKYIPDDEKTKIIERSMLADDNFFGLTPKKVHHYLSTYWTQLPSGTRYKLMGQESDISDSDVLSPEDAQSYIEEWKKAMEGISEPEKRTFVHRFKSKYKESVKIEQEVVDCPDCENDSEARVGCTGCNGFGRIKIMKK